MFSHLLSLLITSVYIVIGLLVKLYRSRSSLPMLRKPPDRMKLTDLNTDCLLRIIDHLPLETRLCTLRLLCSHWKETIEELSSRFQRRLILQLGTGISRQNQIKVEVESYCDTLTKTNSTLHTLNLSKLTEEVTPFLTSTFPCLHTLVVIVSDSTEDLTFLYYLPRLISAYTHSLTTLQLFWNVKKGPFEANFDPLMTSINAIYGLRRLSFIDLTSPKALQVPLFDLPLLRSLDRLDFQAAHLNQEFVPLWSPHLRARKQLMKINFGLPLSNRLPPILTFSADVAAHFHLYSQLVNSSVELENFCNIFTNLEMLILKTFSLPFGETITRLANLPRLTCLFLLIVRNINELLLQLQPPPLITVQRVYLFFNSQPTFHHTYLETLNLWEVFPKVQFAALCLQTTHCADCGWQIKVRQDLDNGEEQFEPVDDKTVGQIEQCLTKLSSLHAKVSVIEIRKNWRLLFKANVINGKKKLLFTNLLDCKLW